ncbi:MAG TPA: L,D-transpeptidase [Chthoniobacterales bacterium]
MVFNAQAGPRITPAVKLVEIDKTRQHLRAFEGGRLVFQSRISTGKWDRSTPNGHFRVRQKFRMHYSRLYDNAPMPYSVHVVGNIFIHGFSYVPQWPASHGCIRLPLGGDNPARRFYYWVEPGTPVKIIGRWKGPPNARLRLAEPTGNKGPLRLQQHQHSSIEWNPRSLSLSTPKTPSTPP